MAVRSDQDVHNLLMHMYSIERARLGTGGYVPSLHVVVVVNVVFHGGGVYSVIFNFIYNLTPTVI